MSSETIRPIANPSGLAIQVQIHWKLNAYTYVDYIRPMNFGNIAPIYHLMRRTDCHALPAASATNTKLTREEDDCRQGG